MIQVEMEVWVRRYQVNVEKLKKCLKQHRPKSKEWLAEQLDVPKTLVEHWFRNDKYFSIPSAEIWLELKSLLGIETTEFDESIMTLDALGGKYDMSNRIYDDDISPTISTQVERMFYLVER